MDFFPPYHQIFKGWIRITSSQCRLEMVFVTILAVFQIHNREQLKKGFSSAHGLREQFTRWGKCVARATLGWQQECGATHISGQVQRKDRSPRGVIWISPLPVNYMYIWPFEAGSRLNLGLVVAELVACQLSHAYATRFARQEVRLSLLSASAGKGLSHSHILRVSSCTVPR